MASWGSIHPRDPQLLSDYKSMSTAVHDRVAHSMIIVNQERGSGFGARNFALSVMLRSGIYTSLLVLQAVVQRSTPVVR